MIEITKRWLMALLFVYLGGLLLGTAHMLVLGCEGWEALEEAAQWPRFVLTVLAFQLST
jgi:hypothetical protein